MKKLGNALIVIGVLLCAYSLFGRFYGAPTIGFGVIHLRASSGIIMATFLVALGIAIDMWGEK